ncbi:MAG: hypothetical protein QM709_04580 [Spongiibacteraceae bacterium]
MSEITFDVGAIPVAELVPHKDSMLLLDVVRYVDADRVEAEVVVRDDGLFDDGRGGVPAWLGMEYMAQTIAAYAGTHGRQAGEGAKIGFLLGTRSFKSNVEQLPFGTRLTISAEKLLQDENGMAAFQCKVTGMREVNGAHSGNQLTIAQEAVLNVFQPDDPEKILLGA